MFFLKCINRGKRILFSGVVSLIIASGFGAFAELETTDLIRIAVIGDSTVCDFDVSRGGLDQDSHVNLVVSTTPFRPIRVAVDCNSPVGSAGEWIDLKGEFAGRRIDSSLGLAHIA